MLKWPKNICSCIYLWGLPNCYSRSIIHSFIIIIIIFDFVSTASLTVSISLPHSSPMEPAPSVSLSAHSSFPHSSALYFFIFFPRSVSVSPSLITHFRGFCVPPLPSATIHLPPTFHSIPLFHASFSASVVSPGRPSMTESTRADFMRRLDEWILQNVKKRLRLVIRWWNWPINL